MTVPQHQEATPGLPCVYALGKHGWTTPPGTLR
jgi:hypothetical protein